MNEQIEGHLATFPAILLRPRGDSSAPSHFSALAVGLYTTIDARRSFVLGGLTLTASEDDEQLMRGIFYVRRALTHDGHHFPTPHVGDLIGLKLNSEIVGAYQVKATGGESPFDPLNPDELQGDETISELRRDLASISSMRVGVDNPAAVSSYLQGRP
ncbi:MAG TPA: hypothetical protein VLJ86_20785 [Ramlibacter sp.]|nr:hypothetical protein [Ramlibacter sp.]